MQVIRNIIIAFCFLQLFSCGKASLLPSEMVAWVNDAENGLLLKKEVPPLKVEVLYKPLSYIIANEERSDQIDPQQYAHRSKELEGMQYYTLKLSILGEAQNIMDYEVADKMQQQDRISYFSFAMQKDIKLIEAGDTLACQLFHFERSYDLAAHRSFVLAFEQRPEQKTKDKTLVLDLPFFRTGPIKINFKETDLESIPKLKL